MGELVSAAKSKPLSSSGRRSAAPVRPPSGHVFRVDRRRGSVWYAKYRPVGGRQVQRKLGPAGGSSDPQAHTQVDRRDSSRAAYLSPSSYRVRRLLLRGETRKCGPNAASPNRLEPIC